MPSLRKSTAGDSLVQDGSGKDAVNVEDAEIASVLYSIEQQLKIMNLHLAMLTDTHYTKRDVE